MRKNESLEEMVTRRNKRLKSLFLRNGINVRLVGDDQKPAVIMDESVVLSCYVKNFDLHFTKEPFSDDIVKTVKLKHDPEITRFELQEVVESCKHRPVYRILLKDTDLYLVGYNYLNSEDSVGRYPVFAKFKPKVYFDRIYAEKVAESLTEEGYVIEII
ncbi:MAG: hypothetical protein JXA77_12065 [Bacteroidales bacterium]|nr:hypothetical protein [Bacteroidales bacterium]MBN2821296.1 hypothetical protein [Bacteroidales bacterium]